MTFAAFRLTEPRGALALLGLAMAVAWAYLFWMAWGMQHMDVPMLLMPSMTDWGAVDLLLVWVMWALMMAGMMLPSAVPTVQAFNALANRVSPPRPATHAVAFAGGYLVPWIGFSAAATLLQWALLEWRLVSPMMEASNPWFAAGLLVLAGGYQFTRSKWACLERCSAPVAFLVREWRPRAKGAALMGVLHGAFCLGCCWALMLLLFVLGVMNLLWVVALTLLVLAEKTLGRRRWVPWVSGVALCVWGLWLGWTAAK